MENLERIQKRFPWILYYKSFGCYDDDITYRERALAFELTTSKVSWYLILLLVLHDLLCDKIESTYLLTNIHIYVLSKKVRSRSLFQVPECRTTRSGLARMNRAIDLYNKLSDFYISIDIFYDNEKKFVENPTQSLMQLHGSAGITI